MIAPNKDAATLTVIPTTSPQDPKTSELVTTLRDRLPNGVYVGGAVAMLDDMAAKIASRLPLFIALVIGLSIFLLMAVFRSIWVPLVSAAFNLLSIGAAYGVVVLVFQTGMDVPIVSFVPLFMFAILFGLSMDYNVFLQSRIREEYLNGATPDQSVTRALARVGRIILAAGAIMTERLSRLRRRPGRRGQDDRPGPGERDPDRRPDRPDDPRARRDDPARRPGLDPPRLARSRAAADLAGGRAHSGSRGLAGGLGPPQAGDAPDREHEEHRGRDAVHQCGVERLA